jgi:DNA-binding XRE family transcriptional regulator
MKKNRYFKDLKEGLATALDHAEGKGVLRTGSFGKLLDSLVKGEATPGLLVRAFRKREGFTQRDMEAITGVRGSTLSALENDRIAMTQRYAEIFAAALDVHPTAFLYPNGQFKKGSEILRIEKKRAQLLKRKSG